MEVGRKLLTIIEITIFFSMFCIISAFYLTSVQNNQVVEITEDFVEMVRYKGCITEDMYYEVLRKWKRVKLFS